VPANGKVCLWSEEQVERESTFTYAAVERSSNGVGKSQTVTVVSYNVQTCPTIPDFGPSGFVTPPSSPAVAIQFDGLQIKFDVTVTYVRNQTAWLIDFFDFDGHPGGDSACGSGRTCSNHDESAFEGVPFSQWWHSQPRANFDRTVHSSVGDALNNGDRFPMHSATNTRWTATSVGCDKVRYSATVPTTSLISNGPGSCGKAGSNAPAASASGLNYTANLYAIVLRPRDIDNERAGYYKATFVRPFTFSLPQESVGLLVGRSSKLAHRVQTQRQAPSISLYVTVVDMRVTLGANLSLQLETTISNPGFNSSNVAEGNFSLVNYPSSAAHVSASKPPVLQRVSDNGKCATGTTDPCVIVWQVTLPELSIAEAGSILAYNQQYVGQYSFTWLTSDNDALASNLTIYAVAPNSTDLGQLTVASAVQFFPSRAAMTNTSSTGLSAPTFSSGEKVWVRHSFLVDSADVSAYRFALQRAWVCWSPVPDFVPSVSPGTGCSQDIPGVMEEALGHRFLLFNISGAGGIADETVPAGSAQKSRIWGWTQVGPSDGSWTDNSTVHNGFGINALPLVFGPQAGNHPFYFHLVSTVSQSPLANKRVNHQQQQQEERVTTTTLVVLTSTDSLGRIRVTLPPPSDEQAATSGASRLFPSTALLRWW
jgi:hypothetical protein